MTSQSQRRGFLFRASKGTAAQAVGSAKAPIEPFPCEDVKEQQNADSRDLSRESFALRPISRPRKHRGWMLVSFRAQNFGYAGEPT